MIAISDVVRQPGSPSVGRQFRAAIAALMSIVFVQSILLAAPNPASAQGRDPAYAEFYETLDVHGEWVDHPRYGETWVPYANDDREWRPYSRGKWVYTEEHGWYWESDEEWGWITYHYGRWLLDQHHGWMWVPGHEWAPAWVAWREGEDAIGWAPLPPEAELQPGDGGFSTFDSYDSPRNAPMWMFVAPAMLTVAGVYRHFHPPARNVMHFGRTRFVTHYSYRGQHIYNRGIDRRFVERHAQRPIPVLQVRPLRGPRDMPQGRYDGRGDSGSRHVGVYRPIINMPAPNRASPPPPPGPGYDRGRGGDRSAPRSDTGWPAPNPDGRGREPPRRGQDTPPYQPPAVNNPPSRPVFGGGPGIDPRRGQDTPPYRPPAVNNPPSTGPVFGGGPGLDPRRGQDRPPNQPPAVNNPPRPWPGSDGGRHTPAPSPVNTPPPQRPQAAPPPPPRPPVQAAPPPPQPPPVVARRPPPPPQAPPAANDGGRQPR